MERGTKIREANSTSATRSGEWRSPVPFSTLGDAPGDASRVPAFGFGGGAITAAEWGRHPCLGLGVLAGGTTFYCLIVADTAPLILLG